MNQILEDIQRLSDEYLRLTAGPENRHRLACWEPEVCARDQWHGRSREGAFKNESSIPITIDIQHPLWLERFPQDLSHTFTDPAAYLLFYLQKRVTQFKEIPDDTPLEPIIPLWLHTPFEMSLFGMPFHYYPDKDPLMDSNSPVCGSFEELDRLDAIDFYKSGMMPVAHKIYNGIKEIVGKSFTVLFPEWTRGPFGVAMHIGGYNDMLLKMAEDPDFVHALMRRVTNERKNYFKARAQFIGETNIPPGSLFNDEVDTGVIGPMHYRNFIKPYEMELGIFHGRISYWHSCGNTGSIVKDVAKMDYVDVLDISGYTDTEKALSSLNGNISRLDIRLHPLRDLQDASLAWMEDRVRRVVTLCRKYNVPSVSLRVSGLNPWETAEKDFNKIRQWVSIARKVIFQNKDQ